MEPQSLMTKQWQFMKIINKIIKLTFTRINCKNQAHLFIIINDTFLN